MNFEELYKKIANLDNPAAPLDESLSECMCDGTPDQPAQQDTVNMNVSITGQGANGIRDLMDILKNIDKNPAQSVEPIMEPRISHDEPEELEEPEEEVVIIGRPDESYEEVEPIEPQHEIPADMILGGEEEELEDDFENSAKGFSGPKTYGIAAVTAIGDDLLSKGGPSPSSRAPGSNPLRKVDESLVRNLKNLYDEVKSR